jgi:uncharacterized protein YcaQ
MPIKNEKGLENNRRKRVSTCSIQRSLVRLGYVLIWNVQYYIVFEDEIIFSRVHRLNLTRVDFSTGVRPIFQT